jgi:uncharacterized membrane protein HdeD (DUF308 family)
VRAEFGLTRSRPARHIRFDPGHPRARQVGNAAWLAGPHADMVIAAASFDFALENYMSPLPETSYTEIHLIGFDGLGKKWGWLCGLGLLLILLGMIAIAAAVFVTLATMVFFGCLLLLAGILQTMHAIAFRGWSGFYIDLIVGLLYVVIGLMVVFHPGATAVALTLIIAVLLILSGIFRIVIAWAVSYQNRVWLFLHGIVNLLLGFVILSSWPVSGSWIIGLFIGIDMIFNGVSLTMLGLAAKKLSSLP